MKKQREPQERDFSSIVLEEQKRASDNVLEEQKRASDKIVEKSTHVKGNLLLKINRQLGAFDTFTSKLNRHLEIAKENLDKAKQLVKQNVFSQRNLDGFLGSQE